jgi:hypothetical protein
MGCLEVGFLSLVRLETPRVGGYWVAHSVVDCFDSVNQLRVLEATVLDRQEQLSLGRGSQTWDLEEFHGQGGSQASTDHLDSK